MYKSSIESFIGNITVTGKKRIELLASRDAIKKLIFDKFYEDYEIIFRGQGSYDMHTLINPDAGQEYDLDLGVFIQVKQDKRNSFDRPKTVKNNLKNIVDSQTNAPTQIKKSCVRVNYASKNYHIDLPVYIEFNDNKYLARGDDEWMISDPQANTDWFNKKASDDLNQIRKTVKLLKAWKSNHAIKFSGLAIAILATNECVSQGDLFETFCYTTERILENLKKSFSCKKPYFPYNDVLIDLSDNQKSNVIDALKKLIDYQRTILDSEDVEIVNKCFFKIFGSRFPRIEKIDPSKLKQYKSKPLINNKNESGK
ncbi:MAG: nucleotidyltransferase [Tenericutes bacterium]|nr:nucleotidyltransferase [Mycoplasmatota bacterium]